MVIFQVTSPSVQDTEEADLFAAQVFRFGHQGADRFGSGAKDRFVADLRVGAQQRPQLLGNREGDDKMLHWQQFAGLLGQPVLRLVLLAIRTMPIATTATDPMKGPARLAAIRRMAKLTGLTAQDQSQHLAVVGRHAFSVLGDVGRSKLAQCVGDGEVRRLGVGDTI